MAQRMLKADAVRILSQANVEASFLANVLLTRGYPARYLIGAARLVQTGHDLRILPFCELPRMYSERSHSYIVSLDGYGVQLDNIMDPSAALAGVSFTATQPNL